MTEQRQQNTLEAVLHEAIRAQLLETHTALPGIVEKFDPATVTAEVRIPLNRVSIDLDGKQDEIPWPKLVGVPVQMPHAGGFSITMPVAAGDEVLLVFLERDASRWLKAAVEQRPETFRHHDLGDAVALVGFNSQPGKVSGYSPTALELRSPDAAKKITITPAGAISVTGASLAFGIDGGDELFAVLEQLCDAITALKTVSVPVPAGSLEAIDPITAAAIAAVKAKLTAMKP